MGWCERFACDPDILVGKPIAKGAWLSVEVFLGWLAQGWTRATVLESYPQLTRHDTLAALPLAAEKLREESCMLPDSPAA